MKELFVLGNLNCSIIGIRDWNNVITGQLNSLNSNVKIGDTTHYIRADNRIYPPTIDFLLDRISNIDWDAVICSSLILLINAILIREKSVAACADAHWGVHICLGDYLNQDPVIEGIRNLCGWIPNGIDKIRIDKIFVFSHNWISHIVNIYC